MLPEEFQVLNVMSSAGFNSGNWLSNSHDLLDLVASLWASSLGEPLEVTTVWNGEHRPTANRELWRHPCSQ